MNSQQILTNGNRAVVINVQPGHVWANLYVNARNGIQNATICRQRFSGSTVKGAERWAAKVLAA
jgi:hypothetical protein